MAELEIKPNKKEQEFIDYVRQDEKLTYLVNKSIELFPQVGAKLVLAGKATVRNGLITKKDLVYYSYPNGITQEELFAMRALHFGGFRYRGYNPLHNGMVTNLVMDFDVPKGESLTDQQKTDLAQDHYSTALGQYLVICNSSGKGNHNHFFVGNGGISFDAVKKLGGKKGLLGKLLLTEAQIKDKIGIDNCYPMGTNVGICLPYFGCFNPKFKCTKGINPNTLGKLSLEEFFGLAEKRAISPTRLKEIITALTTRKLYFCNKQNFIRGVYDGNCDTATYNFITQFTRNSRSEPTKKYLRSLVSFMAGTLIKDKSTKDHLFKKIDELLAKKFQERNIPGDDNKYKTPKCPDCQRA